MAETPLGGGMYDVRPILSAVTALGDICTREDCERLVRAFYGQALRDPIIGYLFTDVANLDLEAHVPKITAFWETVLLGAHSYRGGAFASHAVLHMKAPLQRGHFERWLWLWHTTVDELFAGERAELAKTTHTEWRSPSTAGSRPCQRWRRSRTVGLSSPSTDDRPRQAQSSA